MFHFLLIRAGATEFDGDHRIVGQLNIPLSDAGKQQVQDLAAAIVQEVPYEIQAVYASKHPAELETAKAVAEATRSKVVHWKQLANLDQGLWQGQTADAIRSHFPKVYRRWQEQPETVCPPEGETLPAARERLAEVLAKVEKRTKSGIIAVVLAEPMASILAAYVKQQGLGDLWQTEKNRAQWELIEVPARLSAMA